MKNKLATVALLSALLFVGCGSKDDTTGAVAESRELRLSDAKSMTSLFRSLLARPERAPFMIIEEPHTGKFVQFSGSQQEDLLLDLPKQTLNEEEMARAAEVFRELGIDGPKEYLLYDLHGEPAEKQVTFQMTLGRDAARAADVARSVFERAYEFSPATLLKATIDVGVSEADLNADGIKLPTRPCR